MMAIMNAMTTISAALTASGAIRSQTSFRSRASSFCRRSCPSDAIVRTPSVSERMYTAVRRLVSGEDEVDHKSLNYKRLGHEHSRLETLEKAERTDRG